MRYGAAIADDNGTPWRWPRFPWTLFCVLTIRLCVRGFALSLSFDPALPLRFDAAMGLSSAWGTYFLVPIFLAIAALVLEAGLQAENRLAQNIALVIPAMCLRWAMPFGPASGPFAEFLAEFRLTLASLVMLTLAFSTMLYTVVWSYSGFHSSV